MPPIKTKPSLLTTFLLVVLWFLIVSRFGCGGPARPIDKQTINKHQQKVEDENQSND